MRGYDGAVVVVSHDRAFMDNMVDRVAEIDAGRLELYKGNYSAYLKQRDERIERLRQQAERQAEEIAIWKRSSRVPLQAHEGQTGARS